MSTSGDIGRFQKIIKENRGILYKVINIYCKEEADKKDLEQEILIQLWKSLNSYNEEYKLSTWIYRISMNVAISFYRKNETRRERTQSVDDSIFIIAEHTEVEDETNGNLELMYRFIAQLNEFDKSIVLLYLEDYSHEEIGEIVGITSSNVGTKINRIKNKLKEKKVT